MKRILLYYLHLSKAKSTDSAGFEYPFYYYSVLQCTLRLVFFFYLWNDDTSIDRELNNKSHNVLKYQQCLEWTQTSLISFQSNMKNCVENLNTSRALTGVFVYFATAISNTFFSLSLPLNCFVRHCMYHHFVGRRLNCLKQFEI